MMLFAEHFEGTELLSVGLCSRVAAPDGLHLLLLWLAAGLPRCAQELVLTGRWQEAVALSMTCLTLAQRSADRATAQVCALSIPAMLGA